MKWIRVLPSDELRQDDFITSLKVAGRRICLIKFDQKYYATQLKCPHAGADLSKGWCNEGKLICPYHRYSYYLETGRGEVGQGDYIDMYPVELRQDGLYIGIAERWNLFKKIFRI